MELKLLQLMLEKKITPEEAEELMHDERYLAGLKSYNEAYQNV